MTILQTYLSLFSQPLVGPATSDPSAPPSSEPGPRANYVTNNEEELTEVPRRPGGYLARAQSSFLAMVGSVRAQEAQQEAGAEQEAGRIINPPTRPGVKTRGSSQYGTFAPQTSAGVEASTAGGQATPPPASSSLAAHEEVDASDTPKKSLNWSRTVSDRSSLKDEAFAIGDEE